MTKKTVREIYGGETGCYIVCFAKLLSYVPQYLQYQIYADEINNAFILHLKENVLGVLEDGRAKKEIVKICQKNSLDKLGQVNEWGDLPLIVVPVPKLVTGLVSTR